MKAFIFKPFCISANLLCVKLLSQFITNGVNFFVNTYFIFSEAGSTPCCMIGISAQFVDCASCVLEGNKERIELLIRKYVLESFFVTWLLDSTATM